MLSAGLAEAVALDGLIWLVLAAFLAGLIRGFSGFGSAMVFLPVAGQFVSPIWALSILAVMDLFGPLPLLRAASKKVMRADLFRLISAMLLVLPLALWVLSRSEPILFRYLVSGLTLALLALLLSGLRLPADLPKPLLYMVGAISGATGGLAGLPGPPVIFYFMASPYAADRVRANTLIYLFSFDVLILMVMILGAYLQFVPILIGLMLAAPIALGNLAGAKIFNPEYEKLYRIIAFCLIAFSAIHSMPVWE